MLSRSDSAGLQEYLWPSAAALDTFLNKHSLFRLVVDSVPFNIIQISFQLRGMTTNEPHPAGRVHAVYAYFQVIYCLLITVSI